MTGDLLLGFQAENYRSIQDPQKITLSRASRNFDEAFERPDVVPALAVFGANASGKSNFLRALRLAHRIVEFSASWVDRPLPFEPFLLSGRPKPTSSFELDFEIGDVRYSYSFSYDSKMFHSERLHSWPRGRQRTLFEREAGAADEWYFGDSLGGSNQALAKATRPNALFLSTARLLNHETLGPLHEALVGLITFVGMDPTSQLLEETLEAIQSTPHLLNRVSGLVRRADLGVTAMEIEEDEEAQRVKETARQLFESLNEKPGGIDFVFQTGKRTLIPQLRHEGPEGGVALPFGSESLGTQNFIALLGPVLQRLATGGVLVVDEMDTSLHARLVNELVRLFQQPSSNPKQAQLILSTHDVTVMMNTGDYDVLDRDQVWFAKKVDDGSTEVYALASFPVRTSEAFSRAYLMDRFGAVPRIERDAFASFLSNREYPTIESGDHDGSDTAPSK
jgi:uncharacterized protein